MRLLVVEDERDRADSVAEGFRDLDWAVDVASDDMAGFDKATVNVRAVATALRRR